MENQAKAFWVGVFVVVLALFIVLIILWLNTDHRTLKPFDLVTKSNVDGLYPDADVRFRGVDVGKVKAIYFDPKGSGEIHIRIWVDEKTPVTHSTFASLGMQGVTGLAFVRLDDSGQDPTVLMSSADLVAQIPLQPSFLDQVETQTKQLMTSLNDVVGAVGQIFANHSSADMKQVVNSAFQTVKKMPELMHELNQISMQIRYETLPHLRNMAEDVSGAAKELTSFTKQIQQKPNSLLFGVEQPLPGPGERGFVGSKNTSQIKEE